MPDQPEDQQVAPIMAAFHAVLREVKDVAKSATADTGKYQYKFTPLPVILDEVKRACAMYGLALTQSVTHDGDFFAVVTQLIAADGSSLGFPATVLPMPREAQALGSAATYLRRYSLLSIFGMGTEDDDGKEATTAAQTQPGRRSEAERMIREEMAQMTPEAQAQFVKDFKTEFRTSLSDLSVSRHGQALTWTREWAHAEAELPSETAMRLSDEKVTEPTPGG